FFQAEDGIRDRNVTGVQTCALPILIVRVTVVNRETRWANITIAVTTPRITPMAKLLVATVPMTVMTMTAVSDFGIKPRVEGRIECQSNVAMATKIITATRAAMGIIATISPSATDRIRISTPAVKVEIRVRAWEAFTLIMVWPTIAQPPMPPKKPVMMFAAPWAQDSRVLLERVSVMSSTSLAVINDSNRPTRAMPSAKGAMIWNVSQVNGTSGRNTVGKASGSSPLSPTVGTSTAKITATAVRITIATRGAGMAVVIRGSR